MKKNWDQTTPPKKKPKKKTIPNNCCSSLHQMVFLKFDYHGKKVDLPIFWGPPPLQNNSPLKKFLNKLFVLKFHNNGQSHLNLF